MFNKIINWWNKPWTNGTCIMWGLKSVLYSIAFGLIWLLVISVKFPGKDK